MYNVALYNIRQHYFNTGTYLSYSKNYHLCKINENYQLLNKNMAQQIIKKVHDNFQSFFVLKNKQNKGQYDAKVKIPHYLEKTNTLISFFKSLMYQVEHLLYLCLLILRNNTETLQ